jgi:glycosyltransferase involved in cell wall biosynthesis
MKCCLPSASPVLVSVVVCSYNSAATLEAALDSALMQTLPPDSFEVLLVDNGSTDKTFELVGAYERLHSNFRYVRFPRNKGLAAACNYGLKSALGKYFTRLDADDALHPEMLASCVESLERDHTDLTYCDYYEVSLEEKSYRLVQVEPFSPLQAIAGGMVLRTDLMRSLGGYRSLLWESCDLYLRYLQVSSHPPLRIPYPLYYLTRDSLRRSTDAIKARRGS